MGNCKGILLTRTGSLGTFFLNQDKRMAEKGMVSRPQNPACCSAKHEGNSAVHPDAGRDEPRNKMGQDTTYIDELGLEYSVHPVPMAYKDEIIAVFPTLSTEDLKRLHIVVTCQRAKEDMVKTGEKVSPRRAREADGTRSPRLARRANGRPTHPSPFLLL